MVLKSSKEKEANHSLVSATVVAITDIEAMNVLSLNPKPIILSNSNSSSSNSNIMALVKEVRRH